ncbi:hypothetical protein IAE19_03060 [Acinetobacter sp. S40]|uniref:hypothetical protein n=1 Tax=Acinetobacter sp. S40 TaxID=2767434 RepID=UPI0019098408|nr:hypothetical protein [Acinetobacter sp. S40]MBJ9984420.1 hypothetical protein [Acinetobacter sp. S40]
MDGGDMPYGFQCFDENTGAIILDVTDRLTRILGVINSDALENFTASVIIDTATAKSGDIFVFPLTQGAVMSLAGWEDRSRKIEINGSTITVTSINFPCIYGVY